MFSRLNTLEQQLSEVSNRNILISYTGPVTPSVIADIGRDIQGKLSNNLKASRKVFAIFLELAQNIHFYSAKKANCTNDKDGIGTIYIVEGTNQYLVICSNPIREVEIVTLVRKCELVNSLDKDKLRELKRNQRKQFPCSKSKGAGIGITQIAILSGNPIKIFTDAYFPDHIFFTLSVSINK